MNLLQKRITKIYTTNFILKKLKNNSYLNNKSDFYNFFYQSRRFGRWNFSKYLFNSSFFHFKKKEKKIYHIEKKPQVFSTKITLFFWLYIYQLLNLYKCFIYLLLKNFKIFLVKYKPITAGTRHLKQTFIFKNLPNINFKKFTYNEVSKTGRTKYGLICRTKGKLLKIQKNKVDFLRTWSSLFGVIFGTFYSWTLKKYLNILKYSNGSISIVKSIESILPGDYSLSISYANLLIENFLGYRMFFSFIKLRQICSDIQLPSKKKITYNKAKGSICYILYTKNDLNIMVVKLPSNNIIFLPNTSIATIGRVTGKWHKLEKLGKAGSKLLYGTKSIVRGVAKNPVDHPHGGRTKTNCPEVSPWGWVTKYSH